MRGGGGLRAEDASASHAGQVIELEVVERRLINATIGWIKLRNERIGGCNEDKRTQTRGAVFSSNATA
jgi:hypothetical protein